MRVFLTGGSGFLGHSIADALSAHEVHHFCRHDPVDTLVMFRPDVILHIAGETKNDEEMFTSNVCLTYELLRIARAVRYTAFVYIGSSSEYGRRNTPMNEVDKIHPLSDYETTKACGTLLSLAEAGRGYPVCVVRPFSVYGKYQPDAQLMPTMYRCWRNDDELDLAPGVHDWIHVDDFVRGVLLVVQASERLGGHVINLGTGTQVSNEEVLREFERLLGRVRVRRVPLMRSYDSGYWRADVQRAWEMIGFRATISLRDGLRRYVSEQI